MIIRLIELAKKVVTKEKDNKLTIYIQDADNLYPNRVKRLIENSPTAFRSANLMAKYIVGKGLRNESVLDKTIDKTLGLNILDFSNVIAKQLSYQNGFFVHVSYKYKDGLIVPNYSKVLPFEDCRIKNMDDDGFLGRVVVKDWEDNRLSFNQKKSKVREYYTFTRDQDALIEQIRHNFKEIKGKKEEFDLEEAIKLFKGQYYYYNPNVTDIYPLSFIHAVMGDCDTEYQIGVYRNKQLREGFVGKTIILQNGVEVEEDAEANERVFQDFLGAENSSNMTYLPIQQLKEGQTIDDILKVIQLQPQYNEDFIEKTIYNIEENIFASFNNIPKSLVKVGDGAMFGENADKYNELKKFYSEQNDEQRRAIEKFFKDVYDMDIEFIPFGEDEVIEEEITETI